jgi:ribonucleoside-diphosphate reductase alpha chain
MTGIASGNIDHLDKREAALAAIEMNRNVAGAIGIKPAARITTVKPEGTSSLVLGTSSGIHAWHGEYYIRRMRAGKDEALAQYMMRAVPQLVEEDIYDSNQVVLSFPQKAPEGAKTRHETMDEFLERVKDISLTWVHSGHIKGDNRHNVSCTVSVKADEWDSLAKWMWEHRDSYNGISVLPFFGSADYPQAPFEDITKEQYEAMLPLLEGINISHIIEMDGSEIDLAGEAACAGGVCEAVSFTKG